MSFELMTQESTSIAAGASVELLGFDMNAMLAIGSDSSVQALVMPGIVNGTQRITLGRFFDSFGQFGLTITNETKEGIGQALTYAGFSGGLEGTEICLNQAYALYNSALANKKLEFAFSVAIKSEKTEPGSADVFKIKSLSFAVWNTTRQRVLSTLNMGSISDLLEKLERDTAMVTHQG